MGQAILLIEVLQRLRHWGRPKPTAPETQAQGEGPSSQGQWLKALGSINLELNNPTSVPEPSQELINAMRLVVHHQNQGHYAPGIGSAGLALTRWAMGIRDRASDPRQPLSAEHTHASRYLQRHIQGFHWGNTNPLDRRPSNRPMPVYSSGPQHQDIIQRARLSHKHPAPTLQDLGLGIPASLRHFHQRARHHQQAIRVRSYNAQTELQSTHRLVGIEYGERSGTLHIHLGAWGDQDSGQNLTWVHHTKDTLHTTVDGYNPPHTCVLALTPASNPSIRYLVMDYDSLLADLTHQGTHPHLAHDPHLSRSHIIDWDHWQAFDPSQLDRATRDWAHEHHTLSELQRWRVDHGPHVHPGSDGHGLLQALYQRYQRGQAYPSHVELLLNLPMVWGEAQHHMATLFGYRAASTVLQTPYIGGNTIKPQPLPVNPKLEHALRTMLAQRHQEKNQACDALVKNS